MSRMGRRDELTNDAAKAYARLFALLLKGYERFIPGHNAVAIEELRDLLDGFEALKPNGARATFDPAMLDDLMEGHEGAVERDRIAQEQTADDFNLLDVLQTTYKET